MTVHMVRVLAEKPAGVTVEQARTAVQQWADQHPVTLEDSTKAVRLEDEGEYFPAPAHLRADYRIETDASKSDILQTCENALQAVVNWYIIGYHGCPHDTDERGNCSWDSTITWGPVPSEVRL